MQPLLRKIVIRNGCARGAILMFFYEKSACVRVIYINFALSNKKLNKQNIKLWKTKNLTE